ncbi:hypothetical protein BM221_004847 [Beauveria bassiana]|uniref:Uncharacterized protein n=1 Tax=Beauveria bassiana TaxID=176275 RepID=A0A2N6NSD7_BEABA|nr:hypothetical protein BM221_004847 [Beauveria bassiana]
MDSVWGDILLNDIFKLFFGTWRCDFLRLLFPLKYLSYPLSTASPWRRNALATHLDVHNNASQSAAAAAAAAAAAIVVAVVSPLAGQHNEPVRCTISFRWWLTGCEHAEYSVPLVLYVLVCDYLTVLAGAVLCATLWALARALLCSPGTTIKRPLSGVSFA